MEKLAIAAARCDDVWGLVEETISDDFTSRYAAATDDSADFSFCVFKDVFTDIIHRGVLNRMLNQTFLYLSSLNAFIEAIIGKIVTNKGFIASVAAFERQHASNTFEEELKPKPSVAKDIPLLLNRSSSASADNFSDKELKARSARWRWHDQKF